MLPKINICRSILQSNEAEVPVLERRLPESGLSRAIGTLLCLMVKELDNEIGGYGQSVSQKYQIEHRPAKLMTA